MLKYKHINLVLYSLVKFEAKCEDFVRRTKVRRTEPQHFNEKVDQSSALCPALPDSSGAYDK